MKKILSTCLTLILFILAAFPLEVSAKGEEQRAEFIEPCEIQIPPEPQMDPQAEDIPEKDPEIQPFSQILSAEDSYFIIEERIKDALIAGETTVDLSDLYIPKTETLYTLLYYSPYLSNGIDATFYINSSGYYVYVQLENTMSPDETSAYFGAVDNKVSEILGNVSDDQNDETKALIIHDCLIYEFEYDYDNFNAGTLPQDSYRSGGLFMQGRGVCQAYAYAYKYLMDRLGIECHVTSSTEINHAWNIINIDGSYYHVDCTWDDPVYDRLGMVGHGYFLVSDEAVQEARGGTKTHRGWDRTDLVCDNTKYDSAYWEEIDSQIIFRDDCSYYIRDYSIYKRNINSQEEIELKNLGKWYVWGNTGSYWIGAFSGLFLYNDELYYNTATEIFKISVDGTNETSVYKPDTTEGYVYGSKKKETEIQYVLKQSPNDLGEKQIAPMSLDTSKDMEFSDVGKDEWFYDAVNYVYEHKIMTGLTVDTFGPDESLTRSQFAAILYRIEEEPETVYEPEFQDVPEGQWYTNGILWASSAEIVNGYNGSNLFGIDDPITREQMAVMMYRYAGYKGYDTSARAELDQFGDVGSLNDYAKEAVQWAVKEGIINGKAGNLLDPQGGAARSECAAIVMRFLEKSDGNHNL